jgi:hypothetical protein
MLLHVQRLCFQTNPDKSSAHKQRFVAEGSKQPTATNAFKHGLLTHLCEEFHMPNNGQDARSFFASDDCFEGAHVTG